MQKKIDLKQVNIFFFIPTTSKKQNISKAVKNQQVRETIGEAAICDLSDSRRAINELLNLFANRGMFLRLGLPTPPTIYFKSVCSIKFIVYNVSGVN
jgi:hypothetical protein